MSDEAPKAPTEITKEQVLLLAFVSYVGMVDGLDKEDAMRLIGRLCESVERALGVTVKL
jgi:hypothetical protein